MEVAASLIAIGQAAAAIPTLIGTIRSIYEIKGDLLELRNKISAIESYLESVRSTVGGFTADKVPPQLAISEPLSLISARTTIEAVREELRELANTCENKTGKVKRLKYLWKSRDIKKLVDKLEHARQQLYGALNEMALLSNQSHGRLLVEISTVVTACLDILTNRPMIAAHDEIPLESPGDLWTSSVETNDPKRRLNNVEYLEDGFENLSTPMDQPSEMAITQRSPYTYERDAITKFADETTTRIETSVYRPQQCSSRCQCQCHVKSTRYQSPGWLQPLLGSFFLQYDSLPVLSSRRRCDVPQCRKSRSTIHFRYYFPRQVLDRAISLSACIDSSLGMGASLCLKVPRIIELNDVIWFSIQHSMEGRFRKLFAQKQYYPVDCDENGQTLLSYAIDWEQYDIVDSLLKVWNIGNGSRWGDRLSIVSARRDLLFYSDSLDERDKRVLERVIELDDVYDEEILTCPQAVVKGTDVLKSLLQSDSQAVSDTDAGDMTALHTACLLGKLDAVQLLIEAGAKLNARDYEGGTPLLLALRYSNYDCAWALIDAGCDVGVADNFGNNALYFAMGRDITHTFEMMQRIITSHPKMVDVRDFNGCTPLHWLSRVCRPPELAGRLLRLLLQAGAPLEARTARGRTPLLYAVYKNNALTVQLLLRVGADPNPPTYTYDDNLLHFTALFASFDLIQLLTGVEITGIDVDAVDKQGFSPLDRWRWRRYEDEDVLYTDMIRPSPDENIAFEAFLRGVRDRTFEADIEICEKVLQAVRDEDASRARELIEPVANPGVGQRRYSGCAELRTNVMMLIKGAQWGAAKEELEFMCASRRERMKMSPFQEESNQYYPDGDSSQGDDESEWETVSDESEEEYDDNRNEDAGNEINPNERVNGYIKETEHISGRMSKLDIRDSGGGK